MLSITKIHPIKLIFVLIIVICCFGIFAPQIASAADVYPSTSGSCKDGDAKLTTNVPQKDGKTYDCATNFNDGDRVVVGPGGTACPFGAPGYVDPTFGTQVCIPLAKINYTTKNNEPPKFVKSDCNPDGGAALDSSNCGIVKYLTIIINVLSAIVGVVIVMMIIVGGIQYSAAGDDPQKVQAAKTKITNALLALFLFIFMYSLLQWLVPGGIF